MYFLPGVKEVKSTSYTPGISGVTGKLKEDIISYRYSKRANEDMLDAVMDEELKVSLEEGNSERIVYAERVLTK